MEHHLEFLSLTGGCTGSSEYACQNATLLAIMCHSSSVSIQTHIFSLMAPSYSARSKSRRCWTPTARFEGLQRLGEDLADELSSLKVHSSGHPHRETSYTPHGHTLKARSDRIQQIPGHYHLRGPYLGQTYTPHARIQGFLAILVRIPRKIIKLPSQHSMLGHYQSASETPFKWCFAS